MSLEGVEHGELLSRLEKLLSAEKVNGEPARLLHELQVHQVELEMQNRALREAQGELEATRDRYADLYDFAPIPYFTFDVKGCIRELNLTAARMLGRDRTSVIGLPFVALVKLHDPAEFWRHLRRCAQEGASTVTELTFTDADSGTVAVQLTSLPIANESGVPVLFRTALADLTDRRLAESEREKRQLGELLRNQLELLVSANLIISDEMTSLSTANLPKLLQIVVDQARKLVGSEFAAFGLLEGGSKQASISYFSGLTQERARQLGTRHRALELLNAAVLEQGKTVRLDHVEEHPLFVGGHAEGAPLTSFLGVAVRNGETTQGHLYLTNKRGGGGFTEDDARVVEMLARRAGIAIEVARLNDIELRERVGLSLLAATTDLLAGVRTVDALLDQAEAVARLATPVFAGYCGLCFVDGTRIIRVASAHADPTQAARLTALLGCCDPSVGDMPPVVAKALRTGKSQLVDSAVEASSPLRVPFEELATSSFMAVPLVAQGCVVGLLALGRTGSSVRFDARDLLLAEGLATRLALTLENAQLHEAEKAAVRSRDNVLAVVSHDLRNPLSTVVMGATLLKDRIPPGTREDDQRRLGQICQAAARMDRLIEDLLTVTTIGAGGLSLARRSEDLREIIQEATEAQASLAEAKGIVLTQAVASQLPRVSCDRVRVLQALSNLLGNAIKFTPAGGRISVGAEHHDEGLYVTVADTGSGLEEGAAVHIFDPYWRGEGDGRLGVGLGLSIVKGIVEAHGGKLWVRSVPGEGSTFYFTLPVGSG
jgi:PAS domain S-box-containing protein